MSRKFNPLKLRFIPASLPFLGWSSLCGASSLTSSPSSGFRRRPYFILAGCLGVISMLSLSLSESLHLVLALFALKVGSTGVAIADVTVDACIAQNSNTHPTIAADCKACVPYVPPLDLSSDSSLAAFSFILLVQRVFTAC